MKYTVTFIMGLFIGALLLWVFDDRNKEKLKDSLLLDYYQKTNVVVDLNNSPDEFKEINNAIKDLIFSGKLDETPIAKERDQISDVLRFHIDHGCKTIREDMKLFMDEDVLKNWSYSY